MRPDKMQERLQTENHKLSQRQCVEKMVDLINIYHSVDYREGTDVEKEEVRELVQNEVKKLKKHVGSYLQKNCLWFMQNREAWENVKESFLSKQ